MDTDENTTKITVKFQNNFFELTKKFAENMGYVSIQELIRDALREKIFQEPQTREDYRKILEKEKNQLLIKQNEDDEYDFNSFIG